jgi:hypothetical protein
MGYIMKLEEWIWEMLLIGEFRNCYPIYYPKCQTSRCIKEIFPLFCMFEKCDLVLGRKNMNYKYLKTKCSRKYLYIRVSLPEYEGKSYYKYGFHCLLKVVFAIYFWIFSSCTLSKNLKIEIYRTIILLVLCGCETSSFTLRKPCIYWYWGYLRTECWGEYLNPGEVE